jgi:HemY protein
MFRVLLFLAIVFVIAASFAWLADRPGAVALEWQGYLIETSLMTAVMMIGSAVIALYIFWNLLRGIVGFPSLLGGFFKRRRRERGWEAISSGMLAVHAGDASLAVRKSRESQKFLSQEPMTKLLIAQSAVLAGDSDGAKAAFADMLSQDETKLLGLHGLYTEARKSADPVAARGFAEQALEMGTRAEWAGVAVFDDQCANRDWLNALDTLALNISHKIVERAPGKRSRAVILTALANEVDAKEADAARKYALEAQKLAPDLVPATLIAAELIMRRNEVSKAARLIETSWKLNPHPELATAYAHLRPGDSAQDRIGRIKRLNRIKTGSGEGQIALARAAIDAQDWSLARSTLTTLLSESPGQAACLMMAEIEHKEKDNRGAVREWMSRALRAPRDKDWVGDGIVQTAWDAITPTTKTLDGFVWQVPEHRELTTAGDKLLDRPHIATQLSALAAETFLSLDAAVDQPAAVEDGVEEAAEELTAEIALEPALLAPMANEADQSEVTSDPEAENIVESEAEVVAITEPVAEDEDSDAVMVAADDPEEDDEPHGRQKKLADGEIPPPPDDPGPVERPEPATSRFKLF